MSQIRHACSHLGIRFLAITQPYLEPIWINFFAGAKETIFYLLVNGHEKSKLSYLIFDLYIKAAFGGKMAYQISKYSYTIFLMRLDSLMIKEVILDHHFPFSQIFYSITTLQKASSAFYLRTETYLIYSKSRCMDPRIM